MVSVTIILSTFPCLQFAVSLGFFDLKTGERAEVPGISLDSSQDLLIVEPTRVVRVTIRLTMGRCVPMGPRSSYVKEIITSLADNGNTATKLPYCKTGGGKRKIMGTVPVQ